MIDLSFTMHNQGAWDEDWCARLAPLSKIRGLAWGDKLRIQATIWRGNVHQSVHLCQYIQMKYLQLFREEGVLEITKSAVMPRGGDGQGVGGHLV
jgi:hypothetical protein